MVAEPAQRRPEQRWTLVAAVWSILFALPNFYWSAGGEVGSETIAADPESALGAGAEPPALLAIGIAKVAFAGLLLWLSPSRFHEERRVRIAAWVVAILLVLYGVANLIDHLLMLADVRGVPEALGESAVRWHALLWDPYWILGGVLVALAVRSWRHRDGLDSREGVPGGGAGAPPSAPSNE